MLSIKANGSACSFSFSDDMEVDGVDNSDMLLNGEPSNRDIMVYNIDSNNDPFRGGIR